MQRTEQPISLTVHYQDLICHLSQAIFQQLSLAEIFEQFTTQVCQAFQADSVLIYQFDLPRKILSHSVSPQLIQSLGDWPDDPLIAKHYLPQLRYGEICQTQQVDRYQVDTELQNWIGQTRITTELVIPILVQPCEIYPTHSADLWGLMIMHNCHWSRQWQAPEIEQIKHLILQLSIAIHQIQLTQKLRLTANQLEKYTRQEQTSQLISYQCFQQTLEQEWLRLRREAQPISVILVEIDDFKRYLKAYGDQTGESCLRWVADQVQALIKRPADLVACYGPETLVVLLPNTSLDGATYLVEVLRDYINHPQHQGHNVDWQSITLSMGISTTIPHQNMTASHFLKIVEGNLEQAKVSGGNCSVGYPAHYSVRPTTFLGRKVML
ncbi:MAG: diguanylate cyclase domain-containing protein [Microcoleaceae cyanobacterium]